MAVYGTAPCVRCVPAGTCGGAAASHACRLLRHAAGPASSLLGSRLRVPALRCLRGDYPACAVYIVAAVRRRVRLDASCVVVTACVHLVCGLCPGPVRFPCGAPAQPAAAPSFSVRTLASYCLHSQRGGGTAAPGPRSLEFVLAVDGWASSRVVSRYRLGDRLDVGAGTSLAAAAGSRLQLAPLPLLPRAPVLRCLPSRSRGMRAVKQPT